MKLKKIKLPFKVKEPILGLGPQAKNCVSFGEGNFAYVGPLHPDLSNLADFLSFEKAVKYFLKKGPKIIAYDLHPEYQSTKYALSLSGTYRLVAVQHHHAHIASCMAENNLSNEKVIGVAFDGTGLGSDNNLWGAEFFVCNYGDFKRASHLKEIPLLGGERAILEPARVLAAWLYLIYKDKFLMAQESTKHFPIPLRKSLQVVAKGDFLDLALVKKMNKKEWQVLKNMYLSKFNSPLASSMGRLFDAVASLVLGKGEANFEAELAIELEKWAKRYTPGAVPYEFKIIKDRNEYIIDPAPLFKRVILDLQAKESKEKIACRFHATVAEMIRKACLILRQENKINKVVLSGGVFQNNLLLCRALDLLYKEDFKVFTHKGLSCNDSGVSLGQVAVASFRS